jgi:hypothetical protein
MESGCDILKVLDHFGQHDGIEAVLCQTNGVHVCRQVECCVGIAASRRGYTAGSDIAGHDLGSLTGTQIREPPRPASEIQYSHVPPQTQPIDDDLQSTAFGCGPDV